MPNANVLRFSAVGQYLALDGPERFALNADDFLLLVAGSLSCDSGDASARRCLVTRIEDKNGLRLCATLDPDVPSQIATCAQGNAAPTCVSALVSGVPCGRMQLLTLHRYAPLAADGGVASRIVELRHNAVTEAQIELDAGLEIVSSLRIGGRAMFSFVGDVALVALVVGKVSARDRCELERFVLERLAAADIAAGQALPDCSAL